MAFRFIRPEVLRIREIEELLTQVGPDQRAALEGERAALSRAVARATLADNAKARAELSGRNDPHSVAALRSLDLADIRARAVLDPGHAEYYQRAERRAKAAYDAADAVDRAAAAREAALARKRNEASRIAQRLANERDAVARTMQVLPWLKARAPDDPLVPRSCPTCANAPERFTPEALARREKPVTAAGVRDELVAKYPAWVRPGPMTSVSLTRQQISDTCGRGAAACAVMGSHSVWVPREDATPALVAHETMHALTSPEWAKRVPGTVNEAMTEYLTRKLGYFESGGGIRKKAYDGGQQLLADYIAARPEREEALTKAYFTGDFSDLEALEDKPPFGRYEPFRTPAWERRFASFNHALANVKPGASLVRDDEDLPRPTAGGH